MKMFAKSLKISILKRILLIVFFAIYFVNPSFAVGQDSFELFGPDESVRTDLPPGWEYQTNSDNPHGIIVVLEANPRINDIPISPGDFIGAFYHDDNGDLKCGGADVWLGDENIIFPAFGNDPATPEKDGFGYAEVMNFKVFYQATQKEYDVDLLQWDPGYTSTNKWYPLGLSSITNMACNVAFDAYASATPNPVCVGETTNLEAHIFVETNGNYSFQWWSEPEGFASTLQNVSDIPPGNTIYFLEVTDGVNISNHQITVLVNENPEADAGLDKTICTGQNAHLVGSAGNFSSLSWTTSGDGTFTNVQTLSPTYYPGTIDIGNAGVTLSITVFPLEACLVPASDQMNISILPQPGISLPPTLEFCEGEPMIVVAEAVNNSAIFWTTGGDGSFSNPADLTTQYFPGATDLILNEFVLTACAIPFAPCTSNVCANVMVNTHDMPTINAPASRLGCAGNPVNLNSIVTGSSSSLWITQGDGTFLNPALLNTKYYPGPDDVVNGGTVVSIRAFGAGNCQDYYTSKNIQIILNQLPESNAGADVTICHSSTLQLQGSATGYSYVNWATSGDGIFNNPGLLNAVYFPGTTDVTLGNVSLFLTSNAIYPCTLPDTDTLALEILALPQVEIGYNQASVCYGENFIFDQTIASDYSTLNWFTVNGGGTFSENAAFNPTYYPNPAIDYPHGCIIIGVFANSPEPCTTVDEDYMNLCFHSTPEINAGDDATIIAGENFNAQASGSNFSTLNWSTGGDGTFVNPTSIQTEYYPGDADIENYFVQLFIDAEPMSGCDLLATDTLNLTILRSQLIIMPEGVSGFSTYIDVNGKSFEQVIDPVSNEILFAQNMTKVYWPDFGINTINNFSDYAGYKVLLGGAATLQLVGFETNNKMVELREGWNVLPVLSSCAYSAQELLSQLGSSLIIVTEIGGDKIIWPSMNVFTLSELLPGKAYMIKVNENFSFTFSDCEQK